MKHLFIINPAAGSHDQTDWYRAQIETHCAGLDYEIRVSPDRAAEPSAAPASAGRRAGCR